MKLYADGYTSEREIKNMQKLETLSQILFLSEHHGTVLWMYITTGGYLMVGFNTGGSAVPIGHAIIRAWQLIGGTENNVAIIHDVPMSMEIHRILQERKQ